MISSFDTAFFYILYMPINLSHYSSSLIIDPIHSYWLYSYWKYNGYRPQPYVYNRYLVLDPI